MGSPLNTSSNEAAAVPSATEATPAPLVDWTKVQTIRLPEQLSKSLTDHGGEPVAGEQYRLIRTRIVHHALRPRTILVSSPGVGDGKSTSAINLAFVLALREGARTLLIDGDLRRSSVGRILGIPERPGLADVLRGATPASAIVSCEQNPKLHILTAGLDRHNVTELLDSDKLRRLITSVREAFDFVVIDAPPVNAVADYELLQNSVDGVVMIIRPDHTDRLSCTTALQSVPPDLLLGVVVNCSRDWPFWRTPQSYYDYAQSTP